MIILKLNFKCLLSFFREFNEIYVDFYIIPFQTID